MMKLQTLAALAAGIALTGVAFMLAIGAFDTNHAAARAADVDAGLLNDARSNFQPLPRDMATPEFPITPSRVELGWKLFFDPRISVDGTVSCARCHQPALYGTDGLPKARGAHDTLNPRNAPTILNAALQFKAHWRGDRENVEDEAKQVLIGLFSFINPDYASAIARIKAIPGYADLFRKEFPGDPDPVTPDNWAKAIGTFQRTLVTPSRFDAFLAGDARALSPGSAPGCANSSIPGASPATTARTSAAASSKSSASSRIIGPRRGASSRTKAAST